MVLSKIHVKYQIKDPPNIVNPQDYLSGMVSLENIGKKNKKLNYLLKFKSKGFFRALVHANFSLFVLFSPLLDRRTYT